MLWFNQRRDTSCGIARTIPILEYANPKIQPMPEVVRLLNPFTFESAFDVTDASIPIRSDTLGLLITLSEAEVEFFSLERLETCWVYVGNPNRLHTVDGRPLPSQVSYPMWKLARMFIAYNA